MGCFLCLVSCDLCLLGFLIKKDALAIRQVVVFSGQIAAQHWAQAFNAVAKHLVIPFGIAGIKTPYGGVFDVNNALTLLLALLAEWALSTVRDRA